MALRGFGNLFGLGAGNRAGEARKLRVSAGVAIKYAFGKADEVGFAVCSSVDEFERVGEVGADVTCDAAHLDGG